MLEREEREPANLFDKHPPKVRDERVQYTSRDETMTHANEKSITSFDVSRVSVRSRTGTYNERIS